MAHRTRLFALVAGLIAAFALAAPAAEASVVPPAQYCDVHITVPAQWSNGYVVAVTIRNISGVPVTWSATVETQPPGYIVQAWGANVSVAGSTVWILPWSPVLRPGQSVSFGYTGSGPVVLPRVTCQPVV
ncbi:cellulose binding domain-containing protein [Phytohabitans kaempferiae]|uniref:Cellulose binding domain-containing protein n=1 Tax=Phytohabitans kaempferiae TaxID=1620943 RepID=A0ABV6M654_9ACTN